MRLLFFSTAFPQPHDQCRAPFNLHRCAALAATNEVVVVSPWAWKDRLRAGYALGSPPQMRPQMGQVTALYPTFYYPPGILHGQHAWCLSQSVRRVVRDVLSWHRPDAVLSYWTYPDGQVAAGIAREAGIPCVALVGGSDVLLAGQDTPMACRVKSVLQSVDGIATVSDHLRRKIVDLGISPEKIRVLSPAVDAETFAPGDNARARAALGLASDQRIVLWVGRMVGVKGLNVLIDACAILSASTSEFQLCLVGDGPLRRPLEARAQQAGIHLNVKFVGPVVPEELASWYQAADVTVLPSLSEGTPNVLLESRACGTPFVASRVGGIPSLARPGIDELVEPGDATALAQALQKYLSRTVKPIITNEAPVVGGWNEPAAELERFVQGVIAQRQRSHRSHPQRSREGRWHKLSVPHSQNSARRHSVVQSEVE
jgi:glycosyltransferase involved in cell wall biosynthesis